MLFGPAHVHAAQQPDSDGGLPASNLGCGLVVAIVGSLIGADRVEKTLGAHKRLFGDD